MSNLMQTLAVFEPNPNIPCTIASWKETGSECRFSKVW